MQRGSVLQPDRLSFSLPPITLLCVRFHTHTHADHDTSTAYTVGILGRVRACLCSPVFQPGRSRRSSEPAKGHQQGVCKLKGISHCCSLSLDHAEPFHARFSLAQIHTWQAKGFCPFAAEATASLVQVILRDSQSSSRADQHTSLAAKNELRLSYSMALIR